MVTLWLVMKLETGSESGFVQTAEPGTAMLARVDETCPVLCVLGVFTALLEGAFSLFSAPGKSTDCLLCYFPARFNAADCGHKGSCFI